MPKTEHWPWGDAELRLAVARAAGLNAISTLDARVDGVLATAARRTPRRRADLFDRAAEQFAEQHAPASRTL